MKSSRPYLLRAIHEWLVDNEKTPHVMVNAEVDGVVVPKEYVQQGKIVLNISPDATADLRLGNRVVTFAADFGDMEHLISLPISSIEAVYAFENGRGMYFSDEDFEDTDTSDSDPQKNSSKSSSASHLKVVK